MTTEPAEDDPSRDVRLIEVAALFREITARLLAASDDDALHAVAVTIRDAVEASCAITLLRAGRPATVVACPPAARLLEEAALRHGEGPSMTAIRERQSVRCPDLASEARWPLWRRFVPRDVGSVLATPMDLGPDGIGVLTVYGARPNAFVRRDELTVHLAAEHVGLLLTRRRRLLDAADLAGPEAEVVNRAVGILMATSGCPAEEATALLGQAATSSRMAMPALAEKLVEKASRGRRPVHWRGDDGVRLPVAKQVVEPGDPH